MSQSQIDSERERIRRAKAREMSKRVAAFLSDLSDDLYEEDLANEVIVDILVAVSPVVMDMAMKGIFK